MARSWLQISALLFVLVVLSPSLGEIEYEPRLINERATLIVIKGYSVDIKCQLNDSLAEVSLLQELTKGGKTKEVPRVPDGNKVTQSGQIFTINNVSTSDRGKYKCKVKSWVLTTASLYPVNYGLQGKIIDILIDPQTIAIREGESATFACKVRGNFFKSVEWFKDKVKVPLRYITYSNSGGYNISSIQLPAVSVAQAGSYECHTSVNIQFFKPGGYKFKSAMLYVTAFHFLAKKRKFQRQFVGDNMTINCKTSEEKIASSLWVRKGLNPAQKVIPNGVIITQRGNRFYFKNLTQSDAGVYICKATLSQINKTIEGEITSLLVFKGGQKGPQAQVYPVVKEILLGEDFNFSCQAAGDDVFIMWLRNGQPIPSTQTYSKTPKTIRGFTFNENILMLQKVSKMDDSNYTCVVRTTQNPGNSIRATAVLLVKSKIGFMLAAK